MKKELFHRYEGNPILEAEDWPYRVHAVFNPGATIIDGETLLLVRTEDFKGFSHLSVARSRNGKTDWRIGSEPVLHQEEKCHEAKWGIEDPRIVWLEDRKEFAITYVSFSEGGPLVSLATTRDFCRFKKFGALLPPEDKDACLFPRKFNNCYALIHRPIVRGQAHIWLCMSPDLKYWGEQQVLIPTRPGWWDSKRIGLGTQPIETPEGWLIIYHGVRATASGSIYRIGLALLDIDKPWKLIRRSDEWIFGPEASYERIGDVDDTVFASGAVVDKEHNEFRLYYGAADTRVGLAIAKLDELMDYVRSLPEVKR